MKKLLKRLKKDDKRIKEIIKIITEKHNYTWQKEGKEVSSLTFIYLNET